jgi:hypothetical protein
VQLETSLDAATISSAHSMHRTSPETQSSAVSQTASTTRLVRRSTSVALLTADRTATTATWSPPLSATVALLNIEPLGAIICGEHTQDCSPISRYFYHRILTQVAHYSARLRDLRRWLNSPWGTRAPTNPHKAPQMYVEVFKEASALRHSQEMYGVCSMIQR